MHDVSVYGDNHGGDDDHHGGEAYAVCIGAASADGLDVSTVDDATAAAEALGYDVLGYRDVFCDQGAAEALGLDPDGNWFVTGLYFATEEDANVFAAAYPLPVLAIAQITMSFFRRLIV